MSRLPGAPNLLDTAARVLLVVLVIPTVGYFVGRGITGPWNEEARAIIGVSMAEFCEAASGSDDAQVKRACGDFALGAWIERVSLWVAALVLGSGALLVVTAYRVLPFVQLIFLLGIGALGAVLGLLVVLGRLAFPARLGQHAEMGVRVTREEQPRLWGLVDEIAKRLGASRPANLVLGLAPTFYATAAPVRLPAQEGPLNGETLFLSLPLIRLFDRNELAAVVGHELGHFRSADVRYSLRFAPVYRGLGMAIDSLAQGAGGIRALARIPARAILGFTLSAFAVNERSISREREFEADMAGVEAASPAAVATSLAKVGIFAPYWQRVRQGNVARLQRGRLVPHLSEIFQDAARWDLGARERSQLLASLAEVRVAHPTDSHPPVGERLAALGARLDAIDPQTLLAYDDPAIDLVEDAQGLDARLSHLEHQLMFAIGAAERPQEAQDGGDALLSRVYVMAAALIAADGKIDDREIQVAEGIGRRVFPRFDPIEFRWTCKRVHELPAFDHVTRQLASVMNIDDRKTLFNYLNEIARADGEVDPQEQALLNEVKARWFAQTVEATS